MTIVPFAHDAEFPEAIGQFQDFLLQHGWPRETVWVQADGLTTHGRRILVHKGRLLSAEVVASQYREGMAASRGVQLKGFARNSDSSFCALWFPADDLEARYALIRKGVKFAVVIDPPPVELIGALRFSWNRLLWHPPHIEELTR